MTQKYYNFEKLTPDKDADISVYEEAIEFVFDNSDVTNIAISGAYGAGKSSVIESYEKKHDDKNFLHISLAHFEPTERNESEDSVKETTLEGKILKKSMQEAGKSMLENVNSYKQLQEDYKEYIELWIHEIKIPIATSKLIIENNKNEITKSIDEELDEIENYTEQALFYARSNTVNKDYVVTKSNLKEIVNEAILKSKRALLSNKISIELNDLEKEVFTDSKWATFIINQIIQNSIKYSKKEDKKIQLYAKSNNENIILYIKDNGIGIKKGEITRVFEKGFTGTNGRLSNKKSTGIGLYLCKKLCNKLGIGIELNSVQNEGTEIRLVFPQSSYVELK